MSFNGSPIERNDVASQAGRNQADRARRIPVLRASCSRENGATPGNWTFLDIEGQITVVCSRT
jgi:hypothetical protein